MNAWFQDSDLNPASERNHPVQLVGDSHQYCPPGDVVNFNFRGGGHGLDMMDWPRLFRDAEAQFLPPEVQFRIRVFWTDVFNVELAQRFDIRARIERARNTLALPGQSSESMKKNTKTEAISAALKKAPLASLPINHSFRRSHTGHYHFGKKKKNEKNRLMSMDISP